MSNIKELIRAEIKKRRLHFDKEAEKYQAINNGYSRKCYGARDALRDLENFLDTLPDEPQQPTRGYDEAYLNEKIAKASKSWEGVDVDKFMDEVRGREPVTDCHELEEEIKEQIYGRFYDLNGIAVIGTSGYAEVKDMENIARHFADWMKAKMMEGAVEGKVKADLDPHGADYGIRYLYVRMPDNSPIGDKVRIIVLPKED